MANLRELQRRMNSITSTMQITRTMSMISTARIQHALANAESAAAYKDAITNMLSHVACAHFDTAQPLLATHEEEKNVLFILIASDRGLAGGFNLQLQHEVEHRMKALHAKGIGTSLITCGRKPTEYFTFRGVKPDVSFVGISSEPTSDEADRIASFVMNGYIEQSIDRVMLMYWHAKNRVDQIPVYEELLPVSRERLRMPNKPRVEKAVATVKPQPYTLYDFEPSAQVVLHDLMPAYLKTVIFHALLDSAAAEHGARRRAMQSATDSAQDMLNSLSRTYNRERQGAITTELNEIIGGASALEDN